MKELRLSSLPEDIRTRQKEDILKKCASHGKKVCVHMSRISQKGNTGHKEFDAAHRLLIDFVDQWNDANPDRRLGKEIIDRIEIHLRLAYVAGMDDYREYFNGLLNRFTNVQGYLKTKNIIEQMLK
jgi:hypothetical protein